MANRPIWPIWIDEIRFKIQELIDRHDQEQRIVNGC